MTQIAATEERERAGRVPVDDRVAEAEEGVLLDGAEQLQHRLDVDLVPRCGGELVERRDGVAERAASAASDQGERRVGHLDLLGVGDAPQHAYELGQAGPREDEGLAARANRRQHLGQVGRAEDEDEMRRRLLDQLQQGVPRGIRELMRLVEDVDLVAALGRLEDHPLADLADVVDPALRGGVHLDDVERRAVGDRDAGVADVVRGHRRACSAVERLGENAGHRGLARAARAGEEVRLAQLAELDRVPQRANDRFLADDVVEVLRPVLAVERRHPPIVVDGFEPPIGLGWSCFTQTGRWHLVRPGQCSSRGGIAKEGQEIRRTARRGVCVRRRHRLRRRRCAAGVRQPNASFQGSRRSPASTQPATTSSSAGFGSSPHLRDATAERERRASWSRTGPVGPAGDRGARGATGGVGRRGRSRRARVCRSGRRARTAGRAGRGGSSRRGGSRRRGRAGGTGRGGGRAGATGPAGARPARPVLQARSARRWRDGSDRCAGSTGCDRSGRPGRPGGSDWCNWCNWCAWGTGCDRSGRAGWPGWCNRSDRCHAAGPAGPAGPAGAPERLVPQDRLAPRDRQALRDQRERQVRPARPVRRARQAHREPQERQGQRARQARLVQLVRRAPPGRPGRRVRPPPSS